MYRKGSVIKFLSVTLSIVLLVNTQKLSQIPKGVEWLSLLLITIFITNALTLLIYLMDSSKNLIKYIKNCNRSNSDVRLK